MTTINPSAPADVAKPESKGPDYSHLKAYHDRPEYPVAEGTLLELTPEDYDPKTSKLMKKHFKDEPAWLRHKAWLEDLKAKKYLDNAAAFRKEADEWKPGTTKASKTAKMENRLSVLEAKLASLGINVEDLFEEEAAS